MKCKFCGAEVTLGSRCEYCGSVAERFYYGITEPTIQYKPNKRKSKRIHGYVEYTIEKGDTLWGISKKFYGEGIRYREIAKQNRIKDPNRIYPGQKLMIPAYRQENKR